MNAKVCPTPEVVALLRSESLVNLDEPLPAEGLTDPGVPDAVISVNSVLQEVLRDRRDADPRIGDHLLGRLAYHITLWLAAAHDCSDYPRTLAFATHAVAIDEHAARLGVENDYIAFMRGNLAGVLQRLGNAARAAALLRAEIGQLDGRSEEHCVVLCCQARIMLAGILADEEPPSSVEVLDLLGKAYPNVQAQAAVTPAEMTRLVLGMQGALRRCLSPQWGLDARLVHDLSGLESVVTDLLAHLPATEVSMATKTLEDAEAALHLDPEATVSLCQHVLDKTAPEGVEDIGIHQLRQHAQRLIVEALIDLGDFAKANQELRSCLSMTEPAEVYVGVREQLVHNAGQAIALAWLKSDTHPAVMTDLLESLTSPDLVEPIAAAFPQHAAARIRVLQAIRALSDDDMRSAYAYLEMYRCLEPDSGVSIRDAGWAMLARLAVARLDMAQEPTGRSGEPQMPVMPERNNLDTHSNSQTRVWTLKDVKRLIAPDLLIRGLPGPGGIWLRGPHPGEAGKVNEILKCAGDELGQPTSDAINAGTLTSMLMGLLKDRPLDDLAKELYLGGPDKMMSGFTIVLVAVDPSRRLIGAIQAAPPFELLMSIRTRRISRAQKQAAVSTMMKITGIGVAPSHQRRGVGSALTKAVTDLCWRFGYRVVYGQCGASSGLDRFFMSCDFNVLSPVEGITFAQYGLPLGIMPVPGNRFFVTYYDEGSP
jgi:GNAT superfamily N-acetyltransferase